MTKYVKEFEQLPVAKAMNVQHGGVLHCRDANTDGTTSTDTASTLEDQLLALVQAFQEKTDALDQLIADNKAALEGAAGSTEARAKMEAVSLEVRKIASQMKDLEQRSVSAVHAGKASFESVGGMLARNTEILKQAKELTKARGKMQFQLQARNIITLAGMGDYATLAQNVPPAREQPLSILDLVQFIPTSVDSIPFLRESAYDILADIVIDDASKPESNLTFGVVKLDVHVIAHWIRVHNSVMSDMPALAAYIEGRLAYGVRFKLEAIIINGSVGGEIKGLLTADNSLTAVPQAKAIDTVNKAKYQAWGAMLPPEAVLFNPEDWGDVEREKDDTGRYILGNPGGTIQPVLWGVPVILSGAVPLRKFWIGNLSLGTQGYIRQDVQVDLSTEDRDNFIRNLVTIRAEMRAAFGVAIPDAQVSGWLATATGAAATATVAAGKVTAVTVTNGGNTYTTAPTVTFVGGGGSGATGTAVLTGGVVTGVTVVAQGTGYTTPPFVAFS
jgi:HK97 family phage major capsid protein